ncbi:site-specific DNA recombinase [Amycolatopsis sulphurea]|uniref:Site-specific DNA recombinase n=1 Tax=Amycolatopsis sulphurea TaxID=76022 RepID=A0A2A9FD26_9PSEU|nr:site-specific DNA recombinase [Amycolatopsis sulphurea]
MTRSATKRRGLKTIRTLDDLDTVRVGIYVRRSTNDEHQPYSIEAQDTRLGAYVESQPDWRLSQRFHDDASGASTDRPGLQRALAAARAGLIDVLLVYRVDRFSRNLSDMVTLLDELDECGVVFRSATEPFDTATAMGRMLVQMLGMFAQFERDTIIDRVINGMERKHANGKWKGGKRPFGYQVDKTTDTLTPDESEAVIVRLIFDLYTRDRLGTRSIAKVLNDRGHRTTTGGRWSGHQVIRALNNRVYLGELSFREATKTGTHPAIITTDVWDKAQVILDARGESHAHRAASGSDYVLTGRLRCPKCGKPMIGTRATGRNKTYRYYTCWNLARYDASKCDAKRLNADAVDAAILDALAEFYRTRYDLITDAITAEQAHHRAAHADRRAELATVRTQLTTTDQAIDRYLTAFENGKMKEDLVADRVDGLRARLKELQARRDDLTADLDDGPTAPDPATLAEVADHIGDVAAEGSHNQTKALIEALIVKVTITGPTTLKPVFRIPQPRNANEAATALPAETAPKGVVRTMTTSVDLRGIEPLTPALQRRCSTN